MSTNIPPYAGRKHLFEQVLLSGFDNNGNYTVETKHVKYSKKRESSHKPLIKPDCLNFKASVVLTSSYGQPCLLLHAASRVTGKGLGRIEVDTFRAGLRQVATIFDGLEAKHTQLGVLYGVMGTCQALDHFEAGTVRGPAQLTAEPQSDNTNITAGFFIWTCSNKHYSLHFQGHHLLTYTAGLLSIFEAARPEEVHITE